MLFSCLEDLIAYLYAFYESMRIDLTVQFDLLPISIRKKELSVIHKKQPEALLEAYGTFMIKLCDKNRELLLQKIPNQL